MFSKKPFVEKIVERNVPIRNYISRVQNTRSLQINIESNTDNFPIESSLYNAITAIFFRNYQ